jgi:hypothetical protein
MLGEGQLLYPVESSYWARLREFLLGQAHWLVLIHHEATGTDGNAQNIDGIAASFNVTYFSLATRLVRPGHVL